MYSEPGLLHPYFQDFCQDIQLLELEDLCHSQTTISSMSSSISDYDLGGEGDLFKAPEPIIEEQVVSFNPIFDAMAAAASMISCVDDVISAQGLKVGDISSLENEQLLNEFLYDPKEDLLGNVSEELPTFAVLDIKLPGPTTTTNEIQTEEKNLISESAFQKSFSSGSLSSVEWVNGNMLKPGFLDFSNLGAAYGMRRAFSDGDIKALGNGNINLIHSPAPRPLGISCCTSEDRQQKLCRYRDKKARRNFGRKIKYACRKALADTQPRIRGRFAKTE